MANGDFRLRTRFVDHWKVLRLERELGRSACWSLVHLFSWVADERWTGDLTGLSDRDIESISHWDGEAGVFVKVLRDVHLLDGCEGQSKIHEWAEHNPWAAAKGERIAAAQRAAQTRWQRRHANTNPDAPSCAPHQESNAPSPRTQNSDPDQLGFVENLKTKEKKSNISSNAEALDKIVQSVFAYYLEKTARNPKTYSLTAVRKKKAIQRLHECLKKTANNLDDAVKLMTFAIDGLVASDWHMGRDPKTGGKRYCDFETHLFGSFERMERWWRREDNKGQSRFVGINKQNFRKGLKERSDGTYEF